MANGPYYPKGSYTGTIIEQGMSENDKGTPFVALKVRVDGSAAGLEDYERTITMYITDSAVKYTIEKLRALGYDRHTWKDIDPSTPGCFNFVGIEAPLYCKHETGTNGGTFEKWDISTMAASKPIEPIPAKKLRELDMMFGKAFGSAPSVAPKPRSAPAPVAAGHHEITDDDVPF
jgi:hypothetical protein